VTTTQNQSFREIVGKKYPLVVGRYRRSAPLFVQWLFVTREVLQRTLYELNYPRNKLDLVETVRDSFLGTEYSLVAIAA
jgi:hypothetical protein